MSRIKDKIALVTGGTRGIGFAIAKALLARGAAVHICGTTREGADKAVALLAHDYGTRITGTKCNVRAYSQVQAMMLDIEDRLGGLDILINNAGVGIIKNFEKLSLEDWHATIETNLNGMFYCCHDALPLLKKRKGGYIINIGSLAGKAAMPGASAYSASKFGLIGFSEALMQDIRYEHIRVSYVMPGSVHTEFGNLPIDERAGTWKLLSEDVAQVVVDLLEMEPRALPSRVELRPSEPKK
jgi:NAD(P)-dependent dehydrogenase (short-subunit alcohol dehydrogenase family)